MDSKQLLRRMFLPDGDSSYSLSTAMSARSGSGKTTLLTALINDARKDEAFKETRWIYVSVKGEHLFGEKTPVTSNIEELFKKAEKEPIVVFYPKEPEWYEADIDDIVEEVFNQADRSEGGWVIILDDINIVKGFDSRQQPSPSIKKLAVAGRSKGIRGVFITHRIANLPRIMNGNLSGIVLLSISGMDTDYGKKIFGIDLEPIIPELVDYRWAYVDLIEEKTYKYEPISL
jgi:hypothetical protein